MSKNKLEDIAQNILNEALQSIKEPTKQEIEAEYNKKTEELQNAQEQAERDLRDPNRSSNIRDPQAALAEAQEELKKHINENGKEQFTKEYRQNAQQAASRECLNKAKTQLAKKHIEIQGASTKDDKPTLKFAVACEKIFTQGKEGNPLVSKEAAKEYSETEAFNLDTAKIQLNNAKNLRNYLAKTEAGNMPAKDFDDFVKTTQNKPGIVDKFKTWIADKLEKVGAKSAAENVRKSTNLGKTESMLKNLVGKNTQTIGSTTTAPSTTPSVKNNQQRGR